jgi:hypothetical protein
VPGKVPKERKNNSSATGRVGRRDQEWCSRAGETHYFIENARFACTRATFCTLGATKFTFETCLDAPRDAARGENEHTFHAKSSFSQNLHERHKSSDFRVFEK